MAEEKSTTSLNKARVEDLLSYIKQTFYSQAEHEQGIKDFNAWWLSVLGQPNGVPKTDANNKILQGFFPDYILGQLLWGGTIAGNDKISPSSHLSSKIDIVDESISSSNVAKYTGIYFIATADANTSGSIVNSLDVRTGDWVISTGVEWVKIDNTDAVRSVADYVGSITAEELRDRLVGQYKDGNTYKNYALGTMHYADGSGKASQLVSTEFARSILGGIASQSVFSGLYADKAKTLLNKRIIWGQEFDGSDNLAGDLFLAPKISEGNALSSNLVFSGYNKRYWGPVIGTARSDKVIGSGRKDLVFLQHNVAEWVSNIDSHIEVMRITVDGNVGIGTSSPQAKLDVNGTFNAQGATTLNSTLSVTGATTLNSTLLVKDLATFEKSILLANANTIGFKHTDGSNINLLTLTQNNEALFGYGTIAKGLTSTIYGKKIQFKTKDSLDNDAIIDDNGNFHSYHDISATGGVSASGVNDFGIGSSSGGNGGAHYDLLIDQKNDRVTLQLKGDDGDIDTKDMLAFSTSRAGIVPNAPSAKSVLFGGGWKTLEASDIPSLDWSKIATGKPTTLGGYGITDAASIGIEGGNGYVRIPSTTKDKYAFIFYSGNMNWNVTNEGWQGSRRLLHEGNYTDYTLSKSQIENGVFPNMRVGLADDLGDIEETLDEEYTFQPTANPNEIRDGYAQIESLKGNSLVWNQLVQFVSQATTHGVVFSIIDGVVSIKGTATSTCYFHLYFKTKANHKYICSPLPSSFTGTGSTYIYNDGYGLSLTTSNRISTANDVSNVYIRVHQGTTVDETFPLQIHDLTQMFGEGNEPTTVEEFERRCPKGMPMDYNEGEVVHFNGDIKSVGFNQWDEEWELGSLVVEATSSSFGNNTADSGCIRSTNYIPILPKQEYYIKSSNLIRTVFYDENQKAISSPSSSTTTNAVFTIPDNAHYLRFYSRTSPTTYNHDICINISDPDKNGTYEPYTEFRRDLPTELFEGGMKGWGTAYDEIYWDKAKRTNVKVQRIGEVDLGTLKWRAHGNPGLYYATINNNQRIMNAVSSKYPTIYKTGVSQMTEENIIFYGHSTMSITFCNTSFSDENEMKAAMSGVMLYYELAEPIVEEIDIPYMDYEVSNSGTEEIVSDVPTTPIKARVTYNFDTVGTVRQNRFDVSKLKIDLKTSVASLENKMSLLAKGEGVSGNWVLDGLKIGTHDVLHKGNTSLVIDSGDNFGFTLKVADTQIQMSDITEDELRQMINTAWGTNYEA